MSVNIWAVVGTTPGYIPVTALTGTAGQIFAMDDTGVLATWKNWKIIANQLQGPAGSAGAPSLCFTGDLTTGWYQPSAGAWAFSAGASIRLFLSSTAFTTNIPFNLASAQLQIDKGNDITAAATTDLGGATGNTLDVTHAAGILAITGLGGATIPAGTTIETKFVISGGTLTLTHNATSLILLGGADITLQNGDFARWRKINDASAWWEMVSFTRGVASGALVNKGDWLLGAGGGATAVLPVGTNGQIPVADSTQTSGVQWRDSAIITAPIRQTVLSGAVDSTGLAQFITAGAALTFSIAATTVPVIFSFASGYGSLGAADLITIVSADIANQGSLRNNAMNCLYATYASATTVTWGQTCVVPQYSTFYDRSQFLLLHFDGTDGATTITDDGGSPWSLIANAQLDTAQQKFGSASLLLDGTGDYAQTTAFTTVGPDHWEAIIWFRLNNTSGIHAIFCANNAGNFGASLAIDHNAGSRRLRLDMSSNGTTLNIGSANGTTTTIALNTWYRVRLVRNHVAGNYQAYLSNNGAAETLEINFVSALKLCPVTNIKLGSGGGFLDFNGWLDEFRFIRSSQGSTAETPKASAFVVNEVGSEIHWFSLIDYKMYEVTGASSTPSINPIVTARNRVFIGEAETSGGGVGTVRNYTYRGIYSGPQQALNGSGVPNSVLHNLGVIPARANYYLINVLTDKEYNPGDRVFNPTFYDAASGAATCEAERNLGQFIFGTQIGLMNKASATGSAITVTSWNIQQVYERGW